MISTDLSSSVQQHLLLVKEEEIYLLRQKVAKLERKSSKMIKINGNIVASEVQRMEKLNRTKSLTSLSGCELPLAPQLNLSEKVNASEAKLEELKLKHQQEIEQLTKEILNYRIHVEPIV